MAAKCRLGRTRVAANLYLRVARRVDGSLGRGWVLIYQSPKTGKRVEMGLGPVELVPMAQAKELALRHRIAIMNGRCPLEERRAAVAQGRRPKAISFREVVELYLASHRAGWRSQRHGDEFAGSLERHAHPVLGDLSVAAIGTGDVLRVIEPLWQTKTVTASRLRGRIEAVLDFAKTRQWRDGENPARWKGHLENLLPHHRQVAPVAHFAALDWRTLPVLWGELVGRDEMPALALRFAILTAMRTSEVVGARWSEIDLGGRVWTVPAERMKKGREHRVPLSGAAIALLGVVGKRRQSDFVFPGRLIGRPLSRGSMLDLLGKLRPGVTVHGMRSAFRDWASERGVSGEIAEACLAHAIGDQVEASYRRGDLLQPRRTVAERWARFLATPKTEAKVVALRG